MSTDLLQAPAEQSVVGRTGVSTRTVHRRRLIGWALLVGPVLVSAWWAIHGSQALINPGGGAVIRSLAEAIIHPALSPDFLEVVGRATLITLSFAALGTGLALLIGVGGGLLLSESVMPAGRGPVLRAVVGLFRLALVGARAIHEVVWALLLVSVLGLDPLVGVLALGVPFGAQTAKVFAETIDSVDQAPVRALRGSGVSSTAAVAYGLLPAALPFLVSYSFYRFECAVRSAVILGVVGIGGLGQELLVSLQSRNWDEVWTLIYAVLIVSALSDAWSARVRRDLAVASCSDWSAGTRSADADSDQALRRTANPRWGRWSALAMVVGLVTSWIASGVSLAGLTSDRTRRLTGDLIADLWPPVLPDGGWSTLVEAIADTLAMAVLAMAIALLVTVVIAPWAMRTRRATGDRQPTPGLRAARFGVRVAARFVLLALRSVPPTVWAVAALLVFFPGVLPGAIALGLYTGGVLGRLVAEAWEGIDLRPRDALEHAGVGRARAGLAAVLPPSVLHLTNYGLYRFEICVRDTAVVGVVGAAGLGLLINENLAFFRYDVVAGLLVASLAVSLAAELVSRAIRRALHAGPQD